MTSLTLLAGRTVCVQSIMFVIKCSGNLLFHIIQSDSRLLICELMKIAPQSIVNSVMPNGISHRNQVEQSIFVLRDVGLYISFIF